MKFRIVAECPLKDQNTFLAQVAKQIQGCETIDDVAASLAFESSPFAHNMIYKGGSHVAILDSRHPSIRYGLVTVD